MAYVHADRLTALDSSFLALEDHDAHMHVGSVAIFDVGPLRGPLGGLDIDRIRSHAAAALDRQPRFRQKLAAVPLLDSFVWIDDPHFNLAYHIRHTALPAPGDERQLKRLTGRIMSQQLDRGKPLWELWFVEGLADDRFAVIAKLHHCMVDGMAGADLMGALMRPERATPPATSAAWLPRPAPSAARLLLDEAWRRLAPGDLLRFAGRAVRTPRQALDDFRQDVDSVGAALRSALTPASPTPINGALGPHRRFDWLRFDLAPLTTVAHRHTVTLNDVALSIAAGAIGRFLRQRGEDPHQLTFRAMVPVSVRSAGERGRMGNRVSMLVVPLPIGEPDPLQRLARVSETMRALKRSNQQRGPEIIGRASDRLFGLLFARFARLAGRLLPYNVVITNVPGPSQPLYLFGARLRAVYPLVPLFTNQNLGVALFSYDGGLFWGFNADWDALPDLHVLLDGVQHEIGALAPPRPRAIRLAAAAGTRRAARRRAKA
ncbi:MAG: wax ester/triacylglycerol synthase family O-acyltransferase [bacterium]